MEGKRGFCGFAAFTELTPQRPCAMDSEAGRDGGGVSSGRLILQGQCLHLFMCDRERWEPGPPISLPSRAVPGGKLPMGEGVGV